MSEIPATAIEGKVITGGVAQSVTRENGLTRLRLTLMPGAPSPFAGGGQAVRLPLPEPVEVAAGEVLVVEMDWVPGAGQPLRLSGGMTVTSVWAADQR